jgi:hypothetical protein
MGLHAVQPMLVRLALLPGKKPDFPNHRLAIDPEQHRHAPLGDSRAVKLENAHI